MAARSLDGTAERQPDAPPRTPWREVLVWFMRAVAAMWLAKGLMHWSLVLGLGDSARSHFADMPPLTQAASVGFAVLDLVAAVGLWMVSAWGGVIWVAAAVLHAGLDMLHPEVFGHQASFVAAVLALLATYFALLHVVSRDRASRERQQPNGETSFISR